MKKLGQKNVVLTHTNKIVHDHKKKTISKNLEDYNFH